MSYYKPLPNNLTIKPSSIDGLGLFAIEDIAANVDLGPTHLINKEYEDGVIRLPLGGFFNHSDDPNCKVVDGVYNSQLKHSCLRLVTIKDVKADDELTVTYTLYNPSK